MCLVITSSDIFSQDRFLKNTDHTAFHIDPYWYDDVNDISYPGNSWLYTEYLPDLTRFCWSNYTCSYRPICLVKKGGIPSHHRGFQYIFRVYESKSWSSMKNYDQVYVCLDDGFWWILGVLPWPHDSTPPWILQWIRQASDLGASLQAKPLRQRPDELLNARKGSADFRFSPAKWGM